MKLSVRAALALLVLASTATACTDSSSSPLEPVSLKGGSGGGGGGGGGGGKGGGTPAPVVPVYAVIDRVSAAATCTAGSSMTVSLRSGRDNRIEAVIVGTAAAAPTGPAVFPSLFPQTSLGGYETFRIADDAQGVTAMSFGGTQGLSTVGYTITNLGRGVQPGTYTFTFTATNYQQNGVIDYIYLQTLPPHETCTATLTTTAR
ncbi:MAG: hypothetical protein IT355_14290 [Gemmatimonadaceae bacterium]|nr:hypothetical protein [Gemmatimonadaceae bacterium]